MDYILHYDYASIALAFVIILHFYHKKTIRTSQTYVFIGLVWLMFYTNIADVVTVIADKWRWSVPTVYVLNLLYLTCFHLLPFMYHLYLRVITKNPREWNWKDLLSIFGPVTVSMLMIWTSPFTGWIFEYTLENGYGHGSLFVILYVVALVYIVETLSLTLIYRNKLTAWQCLSVFSYVTAGIVGMITKVLLPNVLLMQFVVSISLLFLYMSLENSENDEDRVLGVYNRRGFDKKITTISNLESRFHVLVISIINFQAIREVMGVEFSQTMLKRMAELLNPNMRWADLYYVSEGKFAIVIEEKNKKIETIVGNVRTRLAHAGKLGDIKIEPETLILQLDYPNEVKSVEDIMDSIDYAITAPFDAESEIMHLSEEILKGRRREGRVLQAMQQALANGTFQVYYQPIYSTTEKRFSSAEALIRLYDEDMGFISPDEFIPMAEKNGMILQIGEFVFRTVCEMMSRKKLWEKGIDYVEVNLSVVQCMQEDICEMLYGIMDEYDVPYSSINLEVTETTLARDILWATMERMAVGGVTFSLDDYGTGYSNLANVLKHPFHIIKLDKSMIWYAMENENAMRALRHTVNMMRDLNMCVVAEGVETEEQVKVLEKMGCEYLQGFYFSRPVPEKDFLDKIGCID